MTDRNEGCGGGGIVLPGGMGGYEDSITCPGCPDCSAPEPIHPSLRVRLCVDEWDPDKGKDGAWVVMETSYLTMGEVDDIQQYVHKLKEA